MINLTGFRRDVLIFLTLILFSLTGIGQKPLDYSDREINNEVLEETIIKGKDRINLANGFPLAIRGLSFKVSEGSNESMAREFLLAYRDVLGLTSNEIENNLKLHHIREGISGIVVRLGQQYMGIPVYKGELTIHINQQNEVTFLANSWKYGLSDIDTIERISRAEALEAAITQAKIQLPTNHLKEELIIYQNTSKTRLAIRHEISGQDYSGEWEVITDAITGELLKVRNTSFNCKSHFKNELQDLKTSHKSEEIFFVNGNGNVFNPDPLSSAKATYGDTGFSDNNDNDSPELTSELINVQLQDITLDAGMHQLKGTYAEIVDFESPFKGTFSQATSTFNFTRTDDGFEAVNVYYHIDQSMRYLNETLGLSIMPYQYTGGVKADPSGQNGADNSQYQGGAGRLTFGEGGVDDAEDSDVIHHELGHGLHDWVTMGGLSQVNGLSEGSGDYWAASYNRSLGDWTPADPQFSYVFNWDGHNQFWAGRIVNYRPSVPAFPDGLIGQIHTDGQIWATCMMDVWDGLGKTKTDQIFWEGIGMTNSSSSQDDAANAVFQAAIDIGFSLSDLAVIHGPLTACGYTLPDLPIQDCNNNTHNLSGLQLVDEEFVASNEIISSQQIGNLANVLYLATNSESINTLFQVESGSILTVMISDCNE